MSKDFKPQDYFRYKKLGKRWRKPTGLQSKMRKGKKGAGKMPTVGYRKPVTLRGLERGFARTRIVGSLKDLDKLQENEAAILASSLGKKKVLEIAREAEKRKISVLNKKSVEAAVKRYEKIKAAAEAKKKTKKEEKPEKKEVKAETKHETKEESTEKK